MLPENFEIAYNWAFYLLPLPLLVTLLLPAIRVQGTTLLFPLFKKIAKAEEIEIRRSALVERRNLLVWIVLYIAWIFLVIALSSPQIVGKPEMKIKTSRNFLIVADISFSMAQKDWIKEGERVSRWEAVKELMHEFIMKREGDRMGLIFFGSHAYIQAPFTADLATVETMLDEADVGMAGQMTNIGKAITKGLSMFEEDSIETKVMLLLTDGVDSGQDILPLDAADLAQEDSVIIYTLGIGKAGKGGSDLDEVTLEQISDMTSGKYFRAEDIEQLEAVYEELNKLEPIEYEEEQNKPVSLLYYYPLLISLGILIVLSVVLSLIKIAQRAGGGDE